MLDGNFSYFGTLFWLGLLLGIVPLIDTDDTSGQPYERSKSTKLLHIAVAVESEGVFETAILAAALAYAKHVLPSWSTHLTSALCWKWIVKMTWFVTRNEVCCEILSKERLSLLYFCTKIIKRTLQPFARKKR